ncbi:unnamed protein product [Cladocopium goreaui]|uniref:C3H1-type domain-containing protein n=1 Tax=Cladocopium goreaui TaxID=2562237 RepID=A0A9P1DX42_9DINO|nr:unnamed protein product [Cladocopium goreaui]
MPLDRSEGSSSGSGVIESDAVFESIPGFYRTPCNPCVFFNSASGCFKGQSCTFCHHSATPGPGLLTRPSKLNRARTKEKVEHLLSKLMEADMNSLSDEIHYGLQAEAQKDDFSRRFCQGRLNEVLLTLQPRPSRRPYEFGCRQLLASTQPACSEIRLVAGHNCCVSEMLSTG